MPAGPAGRARRRWTVPVAIATGIVVAAVIGVLVWKLLGSRSAGDTTVQLEGVSSSTPHPFNAESVVTATAGVSSGIPTDLDFGTSDAGGSLPLVSTTADHQGVYATAGATAPAGEAATAPRVCATDRLASDLAGDATVDRLWVQTMQLGGAIPSGATDATSVIPAFTPVLLGQDTIVSEFEKIDGKAEPHQAILQAGSAVLIDANGRPRVRCANGDPLSATPLGLQRQGATITGTRWPEFSTERVLTIRPLDAPVKVLGGVVDVKSNSVIRLALDQPTS